MKHLLEPLARQALEAFKTQHPALQAMEADEWQALLTQHLRLETPKHAHHGDYALNISFLAKPTKQPPPVLAQAFSPLLAQAWGPLAHSVEPLAGFINLKLSPQALLSTLLPTAQGQQQAGANTSLAHQRVLLEFVSANPTGPLHIGHGRWAALGDTLRRILQHNGAEVACEFYVNDYGQQMTQMANSLWRRCLETLELAPWPVQSEADKAAGLKFPFYPGAYVAELAQAFLTEAPGNKALIQHTFEAHGAVGLETLSDTSLLKTLRLYSRNAMLAQQQALLQRFGTHFDTWFFESTLHEDNRVVSTLERLNASGYTANEEGALWFKSSALGDEKDRVLVKTGGNYTYLAADIAYHDDKFLRQNGHFNRLINIWGADHHGYMARIKAAAQALGHNPHQLEILLGQLVNLVVGGEKTRMGKRKTMHTLEDLVDEVGVDATRFWLVSRSADTALEFDVDLAASASDENPVFYTQYAHARCCGIVRMATEAGVDRDTGAPTTPRFTPQQVAAYAANLTPAQWEADLLAPLQTPTAKDPEAKAHAVARELVFLLNRFEEKVNDAGRVLAPQIVVRYAMELAAQWHSFYSACRVLSEADTPTLARLVLVQCVQRTLAQALALLGVSAPSSM